VTVANRTSSLTQLFIMEIAGAQPLKLESPRSGRTICECTGAVAKRSSNSIAALPSAAALELKPRANGRTNMAAVSLAGLI